MKKIYLGTVSMEKNRWEPGRVPTFNVSDFIDKALADGFDGIELWEYHYTKASDEEKAKLAASGVPFIFNSYLSFVERNEEAFKEIAEAVKTLGATAIKFNLGPSWVEEIDVPSQIENLKYFASLLPENVKLLCECHGNTVMEVPEDAGKVFDELDKERFGAIIHLATENDFIDRCYASYGERLCHMHCAYTTENEKGEKEFSAMDDGTGFVEDKINYYIGKGFDGTLTIEFVKFEDTAEAHYKHAVENMKYLRKLYK